MEKNTALVLAVVTLVLGLGVGYTSGMSRYNGMPANWGSRHMMSGGMMMDNDDRSMHGMMGDMTMMLQGKSGDAFDQAFLSEMIVHHEGAVDMAELALTNAKHQEIKDLSAAIITAQNKEIADMKAWQKAWYGNQ